MTQPTLWDAYGIQHYPLPLKVEDRRRLFEQWLELNPLLVEQMEGWALSMAARHNYVSVDFIFNMARFFGDYKPVSVPFEDDSGKPHDYKLNNNDRALFGRYLLRKYPSMPIGQRRSMFDGEGA